jgi:hypothetical protein
VPSVQDGDALVRVHGPPDDGLLRPRIDAVFSLEDARTAFERSMARGKHGKVVLRVAGTDTQAGAGEPSCSPGQRTLRGTAGGAPRGRLPHVAVCLLPAREAQVKDAGPLRRPASRAPCEAQG